MDTESSQKWLDRRTEESCPFGHDDLPDLHESTAVEDSILDIELKVSQPGYKEFKEAEAHDTTPSKQTYFNDEDTRNSSGV